MGLSICIPLLEQEEANRNPQAVKSWANLGNTPICEISLPRPHNGKNKLSYGRDLVLQGIASR